MPVLRAGVVDLLDEMVPAASRPEVRYSPPTASTLTVMHPTFSPIVQFAGIYIDVAQAASLLGARALSALDYERAVELLREAYEICKDIWSESDWRAADTASKLGAALAGTGHVDEAELYLITSYEALREVGSRTGELEAAQGRLIQFYEARGDADETQLYR